MNVYSPATAFIQLKEMNKLAVFDLFSKRQKRLRGETNDIYYYNSIPQSLRVQIVQILKDAVGNEHDYSQYEGVRTAYEAICKTLCREYGVFYLKQSSSKHPAHFIQEITYFILNEENVEKVIDAVELTFKFVDKFLRIYDYRGLKNSNEVATKSIEELNYRFQEHAIGFQFEDSEFIRVDSAFIHAEIVIPTLKLLNDSIYQGPQDEFFKAHEHYRHGNHKEALNECLKSFESTMKVICEKRGWTYDKAKDTASKLIDVCLKNGLIPSFWQSQMSALRTLLESGVPTGRNKLSGHGQGSLPTTVPRHLVTYVLHMTASCIHFLAEAEKALP